MKVFLGILVFTSMALALVDESAALNATPESKKTDLLISTGNGQTIKISTDGKKPVVSQFNRSVQRFRMNKQFFRRPAFRNAQNTDDSGDYPEGGPIEEDHYNHDGAIHDDSNGNSDETHESYHDVGGDSAHDEGYGDNGDHEDVASEIHELDVVIGELSQIKANQTSYNQEDDTYSVPAPLIDSILQLLEDYEAVLNEDETDDDPQHSEETHEDNSIYEEERKRRAKVLFIKNHRIQNRNNRSVRFRRNNRIQNRFNRFRHP